MIGGDAPLDEALRSRRSPTVAAWPAATPPALSPRSHAGRRSASLRRDLGKRAAQAALVTIAAAGPQASLARSRSRLACRVRELAWSTSRGARDAARPRGRACSSTCRGSCDPAARAFAGVPTRLCRTRPCDRLYALGLDAFAGSRRPSSTGCPTASRSRRDRAAHAGRGPACRARGPASASSAGRHASVPWMGRADTEARGRRARRPKRSRRVPVPPRARRDRAQRAQPLRRNRSRRARRRDARLRRGPPGRSLSYGGARPRSRRPSGSACVARRKTTSPRCARCRRAGSTPCCSMRSAAIASNGFET